MSQYSKTIKQNKSHKIVREKILILLFSFIVSFTMQAQWSQKADDFKTIPLSSRPNPLWFWNDSHVEKEEIIRQMEQHKNSGYGGLSILPFGRNFKPEYLSEEYFDTYRIAVEEAERLGMTLWIYDEYGFPSGTAGDINGDGFGRFRHRYPEHTIKRLDKREYIPVSGSQFEISLPEEQLMAVVAMDTLTFERIDLNSHIISPMLKWNVPAGNWKVMLFTCVDDGNTIVDYMSPEAVQHYIQMTHAEYYKRFGKHFGKTIRGTFFDEPTLYYAQGRCWTPEFNRKFEAHHGFSPALYYPALWYYIGEETEEARNYLFGFRSQLYAEGYTKQINDWSKAHGILATGHQDNEEMINPVGTSGDFMKCFQYLEVPGIDKIGGNRPAEKYYKLVSSAAYNWDHSLVMSETYGNMGNITWETIYSIAMDQYAKGINLLIPHAAWYDVNQVVFKPELSYRSEIYAEGLKSFNDYLSRLNIVLQNDGRWTGDIAILYPIQTLQSGHYLDGPLGHYGGGVAIPDMDYVDIGEILMDSLGYDYMFIHPEILDEKCTVQKNKLCLENEIQYNSFSVLIVPSCQTISRSNLEKINQFASAGGTVIFTTRLPEKGTLVTDNPIIQETINSMFKEKRSKKNIYFIDKPDVDNLGNLMEKIQCNFTLQFTGKDRVRNIHKVIEGKNCWFLANPDEQAKEINLTLRGIYHLSLWDPHTGNIYKPEHLTRNKKQTRIKLSMPARNSLFLIEN